MSGSTKFLRVNFRVWWVIFFCIQAGLLIMMGSTLGIKSWVFTDNKAKLYNFKILDKENDFDNYVYDGSNFKGALTYCTKSCEESYGWLANKWCSYADDIKDENENNSDFADPLYSVCGMFFTLSIGGSIYIVFEVIAMIAISVWACGMICYCNRVNCMWLSLCCACCTWSSHYIALILFMGFANANFNKECDEFPDDETRPKLCVGAGPELSLFILIALPFIVILFCVVGCKLQRKHGCDGLSKNEDYQNAHRPAPIILQQLPSHTHPYVQNPYNQQAYYYPQAINIYPNQNPDVFQHVSPEPPPVVYGHSPYFGQPPNAGQAINSGYGLPQNDENTIINSEAHPHHNENKHYG